MGKVKVEGVKQLRTTIGNLVHALEKEERSKYGKMTADTMARASQYLRDSIRNAATAIGWPRASVQSIFWYGELKAQYSPVDGQETGFSRRLRANLVGIRKGAPPRLDVAIYREWKAGANNKSPKRKRGGGERMGMSLAAMFEYGTSKMGARPAFRPAYQAAKPTIRQILIDGYKAIIDDINKTV